MHMGAENMAKKAAKRKNTRKNTGSRKNGGRNRLWIIFAGCCIALAVAAVFQKPVRRHFSYPMEYEAEVRRACEKYDLDPCLVFAVIRTESFFTPDAVSGAGAQGLMQIMPETGRWLSGKIELDAPYDDEMLYDPATNLRLGCWYLDFLHKRYDGRWQEALTAYIAGQGQVDQWLTDSELSKDGKTLDVIPGQDVKEYAAKVMRTHEKYKTAYPDVLVCTLDDDDDGLQE